METSVPVISLLDPLAPQKVLSACKDVGFFYLSIEGVSSSLTDEVLSASRAFFALPLEAKMALTIDKYARGYTPLGSFALDAAVAPDSNEGFYIKCNPAEGEPNDIKFSLGPNRWPSNTLLPKWRETMDLYFDSIYELAIALVATLAEGLGLPSNFFDPYFRRRSGCTLRLLHYPPVPSNPEAGQFGIGAHCDYGIMTLLLTDETPGLQVCKDDGQWIDVPPRPGTLIVNVGDMLQTWTNGTLKSTMHRVVSKGVQDRYSVPFFLDPDQNAIISCLPQFVSEDRPAGFIPISAGDYIQAKYAQTRKKTGEN
jgi:isopenicillin N synthase-like dioxygenase